MRKNQLLSVLLLFLLVPASITRAQTITSQKGLTTAVFSTKNGNVKAYLPDDIRPGEMISLTIFAEPNGITPAQIKKNFNELVKYSISIDGNKFPLSDKPGSFKLIIQQDRTLTAPMELLHVSGYKAGELTLQFKPANENKPAQQECKIPSHALTGSPIRITGSFDGDASNTKCLLDNQPLTILAESRGQCIVTYPADAGGIHTFNVQENEKSLCSKQVSGVVMNVSSGALDLQKGQTTYLDVSISGLQNLPDTALLTLNNISSGVVTMQPSNTIVIPLSPENVGSGTFNKRFDILSIRTGSFAIAVNLDLAEDQNDHPPTQPQPGDNPHPGDTTVPQPQPHDSTTVAQCPACNCSCKATISFDAKSGDVSTYSVEVAALCSGGLGIPPCADCDMTYTYDWTISSSADKPVTFGGSHNGQSVKISNPLNGSFTLTIVIKVFCGNSICTCEAVERYLATNPVEPPGHCLCKADCSIKKTGSNCGEADFEAVVKAECKGTNPKKKCAVASITYLWYIGPSGKGVAGISGKANGAKVKVKLSGAGSYTLYLKVTVTCSDGSTCESVCNIEETVSDCIITHEWCEGPSIRINEYGYYPRGPLLLDMRPGELIGLSVFATDLDVLLQKCIPADNKNISVTPHPPTPDKVIYEWSINHMSGTTGKLIFPNGNDTSGSVLYQIPFCLTDYPVNDEIIVTIKNSNCKKNDEERTLIFSINLGAEMEIGDNRESIYQVIGHIETGASKKPKDMVCPRSPGCCPPILPADWEEGKKLTITKTFTITFAPDSFPDNMVLLNAEANDSDNITIKCRNLKGGIIKEKIEDVYDDPDYTWKVVSGKATFIQNKGPSVVLVHDYHDTTVTYPNDLVIECVITDSRKQYSDDEPAPMKEEKNARKKPAALVGVGNREIEFINLRSSIKAADIAACKYRNAGYDVILDHQIQLNKIEAAFKNPATQAAFLIGNGVDGKFDTYSKDHFSTDHITTWLTEKWDCFKSWDYHKVGQFMPPLHPSIKELTLLGGEQGKADWDHHFFRLEKYFTSEKITYANEFTPEPPRIAPPGATSNMPKSICQCGSDVTETLKTTLNDVIDVYNNKLTLEDKISVCASLLNPVTAINAWDIYDLKFNKPAQCVAPCCLPKLPCGESVQVGGECYLSSSVNYIVFGVMCKLCGIDAGTMLSLIQAYKGPVLSLVVIMSLIDDIVHKRWPGSMSFAGAGNFEYSVLWALSGYIYQEKGLIPPLPAEVPCQINCPNPCPRKNFTVQWGVYRDFVKLIK